MNLCLAQPTQGFLSAYCLSSSHLGNDRKYGGLEPPGPPARTATAGDPHTDDACLTVEARLAPSLSVNREYNRLFAFILPVFSLRLAALSHPPDDHCRDLPALRGLLRVDLSSLWPGTSIHLGGRSVMRVYLDLLPPGVLPLVAQSSANEPCRGEERVRLAVQLLQRVRESRSGYGGRPGLTRRTRAVFTAVFHHSVVLCTWSEEPRTWKSQVKSLHQLNQAEYQPFIEGGAIFGSFCRLTLTHNNRTINTTRTVFLHEEFEITLTNCFLVKCSELLKLFFHWIKCVIFWQNVPSFSD